MRFIIDDNKLKQNKYIPIKNIPIANSKYLVNSDIPYILIFSWNVFEDIIKRNKKFFKGKTIIVPLPKFKKIKC